MLKFWRKMKTAYGIYNILLPEAEKIWADRKITVREILTFIPLLLDALGIDEIVVRGEDGSDLLIKAKKPEQ